MAATNGPVRSSRSRGELTSASRPEPSASSTPLSRAERRRAPEARDRNQRYQLTYRSRNARRYLLQQLEHRLALVLFRAIKREPLLRSVTTGDIKKFWRRPEVFRLFLELLDRSKLDELSDAERRHADRRRRGFKVA